MHQDHGNSPATYSAIRHGFTSVMMDGSLEADAKTPAEYNVEVTRRVVEVAHAVSVEGELGCFWRLVWRQEDGHGAEGVLSTTSC